MTESQPQAFQAEVSRLLDIVVHALYSQKEIFLRELISNAADACDKLRYLAVTQADLGASKYAIHLVANEALRTLTVSDNGIGMNAEDLTSHLGTIARSGTKAFMEQMSGDARKDMNLIGQFGVGFYSAFMVADKVEVITRKAGETQAWRWVSDGKGTFTVSEAAKNLTGTDVVLHLKEEAKEYLERERLEHIVKSYSDHIAVPVYFGDDESTQLNRAAALWTRSKNEITADEYREFYRHAAHAYDDPAHTLHWRAEGALEYTGLLFIPTQKPYDLFDPKRQHRVKLYVRRVFITDNAEGLLPPYLRFLKGVIDSEDLPLNISREMLQHNPILARMKSGITKRVLQELQKLADNDAPAYENFWEKYGAIVKEGLYDDQTFRNDLLKLFRARSSLEGKLVSLDEYVARMPEGQDAIYYITGEDIAALDRSPQLEGFKARNIEVLMLNDGIDDFWVGSVEVYKDKPFKSVTRGDTELDKIKKVEKPADAPKLEEDSLNSLIASLKKIYGEEVKDVRVSQRLTSSPVCLVASEGELDFHLEKLLRQNKALQLNPRRILEINASHALITGMAAEAAKGGEGQSETLSDMAWLLLDQARLLEGEPLNDAVSFTQRLTRLITKAVA